MKTIAEIRRSNLSLLAQSHGGQSGLAVAIDRSPAHVWQLLSGDRNAGEVFSRHVERKLGLPPGWLDAPHEAIDGAPILTEEHWNALPSEAKSLIHLIVEFYQHKGPLNPDEALLLQAFRATSASGQKVILEVANAQSVASRATAKRSRSNNSLNGTRAKAARAR